MSAFLMNLASAPLSPAAVITGRAAPRRKRRIRTSLAATALCALLAAQALSPVAFAQGMDAANGAAQTAQTPAAQTPAAQAPAAVPSAVQPAPQAQAQPVAQQPAAPSSNLPPGHPPLPAPAPLQGAVQQPSAPVMAKPPLNAAATLPHDLSPWGMFMQADIVVKGVMVGLAFASLVTWTIWLAKSLELAAARRRASRAVRALKAADSLPDALANPHVRNAGVVGAIVAAAEEEEERSAGLPAEGVKERVAIALSRIEAKAGRDMARGTGLLATIGSTAPFVGLFGTVWGIMNSFIGIAASKTTNLAVVAPGIAEALLATAIGLVAAIPAVIIYNVFSRAITGYRALLSDASAQALQHLSRDLDRRDAGLGVVRQLRSAAE